jgi:hypothetical protein
MTRVIFDFDMFEDKSVADDLTLAAIKYNYPEFVERYGFDEANFRVERMFGAVWDRNKEKVWQWFDTDYPAERSKQ